MSRSDSARGAYHHGDLRNSLVAHARALAEEAGTPGVAVREVARRAGVSHAAAYHHFGDKRDLLRAVALDVLADVREALAGAVEAPSAEAALTAAARAYLGVALDQPAGFRLMWDPALCLAPGQPDPLKEAQLALAAQVEEIFARHASELSTEDPEARSFAVWSMLHGFATLAAETPVFTGATRADLDALVERLVTTALRGIGRTSR